ncbi:MAG: hypothetical protein ACUVQ0_04630 [Thermoproteota archaeon]
MCNRDRYSYYYLPGYCEDDGRQRVKNLAKRSLAMAHYNYAVMMHGINRVEEAEKH